MEPTHVKAENTARQGNFRLPVLAGIALVLLAMASAPPEHRGSPTFEGDRDTSLLPVYPQNYFRSPLDIPLHLSGNFGELRTNHFHSGIDIKTEQREGLPVYAVADGHISRIKVSPIGYGYALYIDHPNGYTTVYGHLQRYSERIADYVMREQYAARSFAIDLFPTSDMLPVKKGELIALSGNSGGSGGPHLHFEIRETATEKPINPLLFGYRLEDRIAPSVVRVWMVPMSDSTVVGSGRVPVSYETIAAGAVMKLSARSLPVVYGDVGFAIHTSDQLNGNTNRCGIYRIELFVDGLQVYGQRMDRLDFTTNRAMNAHTIYERFKKDRSQLHASYRLPGNPLDIYDNLVNDGIVSFRDGKLHEVEYRVLDIQGNLTTVKFQVQSAAGPAPASTPSKGRLARMDWEQDNNYNDDEIRLFIPAFTLYEDADLVITRGKQITGSITPTFMVVSPYEPVHSEYELSLNVSDVSPALQNKLTIVRWDPDKDKIMAEKTTVSGGWATARPLYLGYFGVRLDTLPPAVSSIDFSESMKGRSQFSFRISDGLSGIADYVPTIDGEWVLMEYDGKNNRITCSFDPERMTRGSHLFEIRVVDQVGNEKTWKSRFTW
ncbi:MAG: M23 family metallopeptidase [Flavobacteriales bacterium]